MFDKPQPIKHFEKHLDPHIMIENPLCDIHDRLDLYEERIANLEFAIEDLETELERIREYA